MTLKLAKENKPSPLVAFANTYSERHELFWAAACSCALISRSDGYTTLASIAERFTATGVHTACGKPATLVLAPWVQECYGCDRWYISEQLPDTMLMCKECLELNEKASSR